MNTVYKWTNWIHVREYGSALRP